MSAVAEQADVAVGGLYRYFDGKDALLAALQVRAVDTFSTVMDQALSACGGSCDRLRAVSHAWFTFADAHPEEFELLDRSLSDPRPNLDDAQARAVDEALAPVLARVRTELDRAVEEGQLRPGSSAVRAHVLWAAVHGAAHFRKRDRLGGVRAANVLDEAVTALIQGWSSVPG